MSLDGRVIAIAGVGGGLGPLVAERLGGGRARRSPGPTATPGALDEVGAELGLPPSAGTGARSTCSTRRRRGTGARRWSSASAGSTGSSTWSAAGAAAQPLHEAPLADWDLLHDLLIRTVQHTTRAFHDALAASEHGRFVLVSAKQAQAPSNTNAAYAAAKAAAEAWTLAFADGFEPGGATANIIVVDAILTPRMREENPGEDFPTFTPAEHLADAIAFLCSDAGGEDERPAAAAYRWPMSETAKRPKAPRAR